MNRGGGGFSGRSKRFFATVFRPALVRGMLLSFFALGLVATFFDPLGDFLKQNALFGGSLLIGIAFLLYDAIVDLRLTLDQRPVSRTTVSSHELKAKVADAFSARRVEIRFLGYTGQSLVDEIDHSLRHLRSGAGGVERVDIRLLIPDFTQPMVVPSRVGDGGRPVDDPDYRRRLVGMALDYEVTLKGAVSRLLSERRLPASSLSCTYRVFQGFPRDKLVIFNREVVLHGLYDVSTTRPREDKEYYDPEGMNTPLVEVARRQDGVVVGHSVDDWITHFDGLWGLAAPPPWSQRNES